MAFDKKKFIARFAEEAKDHITRLNDGFLALEDNPRDTETLNQVFRSAHTIKGSSRILSLKEISLLAHKLEDTLHALRDGKIKTGERLFNLLFRTLDVLGDMVDLAAASEPISIDTADICEALEMAAVGQPFTVQDGGATGKREGTAARPADATKETSAALSVEALPGVAEPAVSDGAAVDPQGVASPRSAKPEETIRIPTSKLDETVKLMGEILSNHGRFRQLSLDLFDLEKSTRHFMELVRAHAERHQERNGDSLEVIIKAEGLYNEVRVLSSTTRDMVSVHSLLTDGLREKVLKMRMLPLSTVLGTFPRYVRDIATSSGKKIDLVIEGADTEMDKKVIEQLGDPLMHMIRNSVDHGIEMPDCRRQAGKPQRATLRISACYEGGNVLIEVSDDGAGIAVDRVREKALKKKLFDEDRLHSMSKAEIINLIFRPGFSTSSIVTDISGRGVGLDVVNDYIVEQLQGSVHVETEEGKGTSFYLKVPVTLAVIRIMCARAGAINVGLAVSAVDEVLKVNSNEIIEVVNKKAIRLREKIIPVIHLDRALRLPERSVGSSRDVFVVMLSMGKDKLGLVVDALVSEADMEIMSLPPHLDNNELIAGVSLSSKDEVVIIVHVPKIFALARELHEEKKRKPAHGGEQRAQHILVVDDSLNTREIEKSILESYGYKVDLASNGQEAFDKACGFKYDLIVTDVEMPIMDGFSFTEKLKNEKQYQNTPVIIVTSRDKEEDKRRGIQVGADAYILKGSFDQSNLLSTVQNLI